MSVIDRILWISFNCCEIISFLKVQIEQSINHMAQEKIKNKEVFLCLNSNEKCM